MMKVDPYAPMPNDGHLMQHLLKLAIYACFSVLYMYVHVCFIKIRMWMEGKEIPKWNPSKESNDKPRTKTGELFGKLRQFRNDLHKIK